MNEQTTVADYTSDGWQARGSPTASESPGTSHSSSTMPLPGARGFAGLAVQQTGRGVCGRWVRTHARLLDADDHVRGR